LKVYMDDMLIYTEVEKPGWPLEEELEAHWEAVSDILRSLEANDLYLKPEKCLFNHLEVEYLGVIVGNSVIKMDPVKVEGIAKWETPRTVKDICSFLGFCNFYHTFIQDFSRKAQPLNYLTKKNIKFEWNDNAQVAFDALKDTCSSYPVLRMPDWKKQFILETDASGYALGAVISQEFEDGIHLIAFHSRSLLDAEHNYDVHDKELAGVIFGFKKGWSYFLGCKQPIWVCTDHKNLMYFRVLRS